jgi:mono/diheme cytochrome c family protein
MTHNQINLFLVVLMLGAVVLTLGIKRDTALPNYEFLPEMVHSIPFDAFAANPVFPDGKTLQAPVPGTIARGYMPLHYSATPEDAARAGAELVNPFSLEDAEALKRGARVYGIYCLPCHGGQGNGDGLVTQRGYPPPPPLSSESSMVMSDGQIFHIITYGQKNMPAYAAQIPRDDRWKAVLYTRELQKQAVATTEAPAL